MKDIDFDELDRAVSSVLGNKGPAVPTADVQADNQANSPANPVAVVDQTATAQSTVAQTAQYDTTAVDNPEPTTMPATEAEETTPAVNPQQFTEQVVETPAPTISPEVEPSYTHETEITETPSETTATNFETEPTAVETVSPTETPSMPLAVKRRGRFMDVVHPSSDMGPAGTPENANQNITAESGPNVGRKVLNPIHDNVAPEAPEMAESKPTIMDVEAIEGESTNNPVVSDDIPSQPSETASVSDETKATETENVDTLVPEPAVDTSVQQIENTMETPEPNDEFNDEVTSEPTSEPTQEASPGVVDANSTPFLPDTKVDKRPLGGFVGPEESAVTEKPADTEPETAPRELQSDVVSVEAVQEEPNSASAPAAAETAPAVADSSENRVFDTSTYHQPLTDPAVANSKSRAWLWWVIGLIVCFVVGSGVSLFLFMGNQ